jgi:hypothetical protein
MAERYQNITRIVDRVEKLLKASRDAEADTDINVIINPDDTAKLKIVSCGATRIERINQPSNP